MVDRGSPVAFYWQIAEDLAGSVGTRYQPGDRLPSEPELMSLYGVSRITIRKAVANLVERGILVKAVGKGTFVNPRRVYQDLQSLTPFQDVLHAQGLAPETHVVDFGLREASPKARDALRLTGRDALYFRRVYVLDGEPAALTEVHLPPELAEHVARHDVERLVSYEILLRFGGISIDHAELKVRMWPADRVLARDLGVRRGSSLLLSERLSYSADGVPREHSSLYLRPAIGEFRLTIPQGVSLRPMIHAEEPEQG